MLLPALACAGTSSAPAFSDSGPRVIMGQRGFTPGSAQTVLYLDVTLNGRPTGKLVQFTRVGGRLLASQRVLSQLGIKVPAGLPDPVALAQLPGARVDYDKSRQRLNLVLPVTLLNVPTQMLNRRDPEVPQATSAPGLLLNYALHASHASGGGNHLNGLFELRAFGDLGLVATRVLTRATHTAASGWRTHSVRLDSFYRRSFPEHMLTLTVGDTLTEALDWSRPTRIAGIQLGRNFGLQPYRITTPMPAFVGQATLPSAIELYINGVERYSGKVQPGPFRLDSTPVINGAGSARVVLTDVLGRARSLNFSFYTTDRLLQPGLSDWSASLGYVRQNYALTSFDYGHDPAASATWRYGLSRRFTASAHGEAIDGLYNAGAGGSFLLGQAGVVHGAWALSHNRAGRGSLINIGYSWRNGPFHLSLDSTRTHGQWRDVASRYGAPPPRISERALLGLSTSHAGNFSISYLHLRYPEQPGSRYASAFWSRQWGPLSLNLSFNQNLNKARDRSIFLGMSIALGKHVRLGTSAQHSRGQTFFNVNATRPVPGDGGFGWRAQGRFGDGQPSGLASAGYLARWGRMRGGVRSYGDQNQVYASLSGSLVTLGGHVFSTRRVPNALAMVSTSGIQGVPVKLENRVIGRTNEDGVLLVTRLNAWQKNRLAIDPMDLPADVRIDQVQTVVTPRDHGGTVVRFDITPIRAASIMLVDEHGQPLAVGSQAQLLGQPGASAVVGYDGVVYLDTLEAHNTIEVRSATGTCRADFDYPDNGDQVPQIGPITCHRESPP